jgi:methylmalonyl-CoA mutase C-terminal domain/subunit
LPPEQIAAAAVQEDVDLVGLSCLSGAHRYLFPRVVELLKEQGADDITVIGGGIIPDQDFQMLYGAGIKAIFTPGAPLDTIVSWVRTNIRPRGA